MNISFLSNVVLDDIIKLTQKYSYCAHDYDQSDRKIYISPDFCVHYIGSSNKVILIWGEFSYEIYIYPNRLSDLINLLAISAKICSCVNFDTVTLVSIVLFLIVKNLSTFDLFETIKQNAEIEPILLMLTDLDGKFRKNTDIDHLKSPNFSDLNSIMFEDDKLIPILEQHLESDEETVTDELIIRYPFMSKFMARKITEKFMIRKDTVFLITKIIDYSYNKINNIEKSCTKNSLSLNKNFPVYKSLEYTHNNKSYCYDWINSINLVSAITKYFRKFINADIQLLFQIRLLLDTIKSLENIGINGEYHIKGGFCRDVILKFFAENLTQTDSNTFDKSVKDIDISMNVDPELFTSQMCKISEKAYGIVPTKRWNNAEKTEKGKNISVWSVKFEDYEPMEFVHFRTDEYDPQTSNVVAKDIQSSLEDDLRRDVVWPSFRLNDMILVDYFDVIGMLNSGKFVIRTPPKYEDIFKEEGEIPRIIDSRLNFDTHIESAERVLRMFKFLTGSFESTLFGYSFNEKTQLFDHAHRGFQVDPALLKLYQNPTTHEETQALKWIHAYIKLWLKNGLLSNVFKSLTSVVESHPHKFFKLMVQFKLLNVVFDDNYDEEQALKYSEMFENLLVKSNTKLFLPYAVLGFGVKNTNEMMKHMSQLNISIETQVLAKFLAEANDATFEKDIDMTKVYSLISRTSVSMNYVNCFNLLRVFGIEHSTINVNEYREYIFGTKIRDKLITCISQSVADYITYSQVEFNQNQLNPIHRCKYHISNMITRIVGVKGVESSHDNESKKYKQYTNELATIIKCKLEENDKLNKVHVMYVLNTLDVENKEISENDFKRGISGIVNGIFTIYEKLLNIEKNENMLKLKNKLCACEMITIDVVLNSLDE